MLVRSTEYPVFPPPFLDIKKEPPGSATLLSFWMVSRVIHIHIRHSHYELKTIEKKVYVPDGPDTVMLLLVFNSALM